MAMKVRERQRIMSCAYCGEVKAWPDAFADQMYARCWSCFWKDHSEADHQRSGRERPFTAQLFSAVIGNLLVWGPLFAFGVVRWNF